MAKNESDFVKFIYSEKDKGLSYVVPVKSTVDISQNFVAFSDYMYVNPPLET